MVAEQFGTLAALNPGRIDLGWGAGSTMIRQPCRHCAASPMTPLSFPATSRSCSSSSRPPRQARKWRAIPGEGSQVPVWILSSSAGGAQLAGPWGCPLPLLPIFAPDAMEVALATYAGGFVPSAHRTSQGMLSLTVVAADTETRRGCCFRRRWPPMTRLGAPPIPNTSKAWIAAPGPCCRNFFRHSVVGGPETVKKGVADSIARYRPDENHHCGANLRSPRAAQVVRDTQPSSSGALNVRLGA